MLPSSLENEVFKFILVHLSLGHAGSEKCISEIVPLLRKKRQKNEEDFVVF
jgi:hypothetical protein